MDTVGDGVPFATEQEPLQGELPRGSKTPVSNETRRRPRNGHRACG